VSITMSFPDRQPDESADRLAIRALIDAWAHSADRRQPNEQAALFTSDGTVTVYAGDPAMNDPTQTLTGHAEMVEAFKVLSGYEVTTHFTGQSSVRLDGDQATGETYCLAHQLWVENGVRTLMVMSIRYLDTFVRESGHWLFAERVLVIDWTDKRPSTQ
jgi:hypothetical protein